MASPAAMVPPAASHPDSYDFPSAEVSISSSSDFGAELADILQVLVRDSAKRTRQLFSTDFGSAFLLDDESRYAYAPVLLARSTSSPNAV